MRLEEASGMRTTDGRAGACTAPRAAFSMLRPDLRAEPFAFCGGVPVGHMCLRAQDTTQWEAEVWWSQEHVQWGPMG